jgi:sec-independent protein translocase protein TatA
MFTPGPWQILIVLLVVLLLFGNRLPSLARSLGMSLTEFKKGVKDIGNTNGDDTEEVKEFERKKHDTTSDESRSQEREKVYH